MVGRYRPGDRLKIDFWRAEKKRQFSIELKDQNNNRPIATNSTLKDNALENDYGIVFRPLSAAEKRKFNLSGLLVVSVTRGSLIGDTRMQAGFIINSINGDRVNTIEEAVQAIRSARNTISIDGFYPSEPDLYSYRFKQPG
jgi:S1-C subfamily serine protease